MGLQEGTEDSRDGVEGVKGMMRNYYWMYLQDFDRRVVPEAGLDEVIVEESTMKQLKEIVQFEKAR